MNKPRMAALLVAGSLLLGACAQSKDASDVDLDEPQVQGDLTPNNFTALAPDSITVILNTDGHPTLNRLCMDGLAFVTISNTHSGLASPAYQRVPEWDQVCAEVVR